MNYWIRGLREYQQPVPDKLNAYLTSLDPPDFVMEGSKWYARQERDHQIAINFALLLYLLFIQFYFFRYLVCADCFREYEQLNAMIEKSERELP